MMRFPFLLVVLSLYMGGCRTNRPVKTSAGQIPEKTSGSFIVAFGSCDKQYITNPFWDDILAQRPDVWIWGGDNVYADTDDMKKLDSIYREQSNDSLYMKLKSTMPVVGTWDDHDYGLNDGGWEFHMKRESQQLFLDFMDVPKESERRKRDGVYASHIFETDFGKVKLLVLDTRFFRSILEKDESPDRRYEINWNSESTVLGEQQWKWLEEELSGSDAAFNLIVSSIQFLSQEHGFEGWGNFPLEVEKLNKLISASNAKGVMILSGDRHISEFSRIKLEGVSYPLIDFTSSGLTHSYSEFTWEPNQNRVGKVVASTSFGIIHLNLKNKEAHFKIMGENGKVYQELKQAY